MTITITNPLLRPFLTQAAVIAAATERPMTNLLALKQVVAVRIKAHARLWKLLVSPLADSSRARTNYTAIIHETINGPNEWYTEPKYMFEVTDFETGTEFTAKTHILVQIPDPVQETETDTVCFGFVVATENVICDTGEPEDQDPDTTPAADLVI